MGEGWVRSISDLRFQRENGELEMGVNGTTRRVVSTSTWLDLFGGEIGLQMSIVLENTTLSSSGEARFIAGLSFFIMAFGSIQYGFFCSGFNVYNNVWGVIYRLTWGPGMGYNLIEI